MRPKQAVTIGTERQFRNLLKQKAIFTPAILFQFRTRLHNLQITDQDTAFIDEDDFITVGYFPSLKKARDAVSELGISSNMNQVPAFTCQDLPNVFFITKPDNTHPTYKK